MLSRYVISLGRSLHNKDVICYATRGLTRYKSETLPKDDRE